MNGFRISDWDQYEPPTGHGRYAGPLSWVRIQVMGHRSSAGYRSLALLAGPQIMSAFGLFCKLLELAADEPRDTRDGTIRARTGGAIATVADIAFLVMITEPDCARWLGWLMHPSVGWVCSTDNSNNNPRLVETRNNYPQLFSSIPEGEGERDIEEEKNPPPIAPPLEGGGLLAETSQDSKQLARKPNPIWDCLCKLFGLSPVTTKERKALGRIVADFAAKAATPEEMTAALERYRTAWPNAADTHYALLKHYDRFRRPDSDKPKRRRAQLPPDIAAELERKKAADELKRQAGETF